MSKIQMEYPFTRISGKPVKECDTTFRMAYGQPYLYGRDRSRTFKYPPSAAQQTSIAKFRQAAQQTNTIMTDIEAIEPYRQAWRNLIRSGNTTYKTLRGYIFAQVYRTL